MQAARAPGHLAAGFVPRGIIEAAKHVDDLAYIVLVLATIQQPRNLPHRRAICDPVRHAHVHVSEHRVGPAFPNYRKQIFCIYIYTDK